MKNQDGLGYRKNLTYQSQISIFERTKENKGLAIFRCFILGVYFFLPGDFYSDNRIIAG